jgi:Asp-tRNA(Asn)/Glu-tRNA(Gln) amidotransferase A subunit family amidase
MATVLDGYYDEHHTAMGLDVRTSLALARTFTARDYLHSAKIRTLAMKQLSKAFESCDVIITPSTGVTAPRIAAGSVPDGTSDITLISEIMKYAAYANFAGNPAISFNVGYDEVERHAKDAGAVPVSNSSVCVSETPLCVAR